MLEMLIAGGMPVQVWTPQAVAHDRAKAVIIPLSERGTCTWQGMPPSLPLPSLLECACLVVYWQVEFKAFEIAID